MNTYLKISYIYQYYFVAFYFLILLFNKYTAKNVSVIPIKAIITLINENTLLKIMLSIVILLTKINANEIIINIGIKIIIINVFVETIFEYILSLLLKHS